MKFGLRLPQELIRKRRTRSSSQSHARRAGQNRADNATETPAKETEKDPFGNWDIREPAHRPEPTSSAANTNNEFAGVDKPDFNIFNPNQNDSSASDDNKSEDTPPFFKRRRK